MKPRRIYWRWKDKQYVLEGRLPDNKTMTIWTLPPAEKFIKQILDNESFFTKEKREKMIEKYMRLEFKSERKAKGFSKVPTNKIRRTQEKDA